MLDQVADVVVTNRIMLVFNDFVAGSENFGRRIQPLMKSRNATLAEA